MARLQILYLPDHQPAPDVFERRFGLVLDGLDSPLSEDERAGLDAFVQSVGAAGVFVTSRTIDCDQGEAGSEAMDEFVANLRQLVDERIGEAVQATLAQEPKRGYATPAQQLLDERKKPTEPKPTRTWGTVERDPREGIPGWTPEATQQAVVVDAIQGDRPGIVDAIRREIRAQGGTREAFGA